MAETPHGVDFSFLIWEEVVCSGAGVYSGASLIVASRLQEFYSQTCRTERMVDQQLWQLDLLSALLVPVRRAPSTVVSAHGEMQNTRLGPTLTSLVAYSLASSCKVQGLPHCQQGLVQIVLVNI